MSPEGREHDWRERARLESMNTPVASATVLLFIRSASGRSWLVVSAGGRWSISTSPPDRPGGSFRGSTGAEEQGALGGDGDEGLDLVRAATRRAERVAANKDLLASDEATH